MYYAHFGLKQPPFKITPNTEFFYLGGNRGAVLDALIYAVKSGEGIIKVVGEVGSGKTMLCRMLQVALPESVESIYLANPSIAPEDILYAIAFELQLELPENADRLKVMQVLQTHLLERHAAGRQVVIFVEEAQGMPLTTLEEIRLLSNLETKYDKLLQIVLFGQPELDDNLNETRIRQLRERITHSFYLEPFDTTEIGEYLIFRLRAAGYFGPHLFTKAAIEQIASVAKGLVRRINILADKSLLAAFADNVYQVTPKYVQAAIKDSEFGVMRKPLLFAKHVFVIALVVLLIGFIVEYFAIIWVQNHGQVTQSKIVQLKTTNDLKRTSASSNAATEPAVAANVTPQVNASPSATNVTPQVNASPSAANVTPQVNASPSAANVTPQANASPSAIVPSVNATINTNLPVGASSAINSVDDIVSQRLAATSIWLITQPATTATIQIFGAENATQLKAQLKSLSKVVASNDLYVYRTMVNKQPYLTVVYGHFTTNNEAAQALHSLPNDVKKYHPHLRTIAGILRETKQVPQ